MSKYRIVKNTYGDGSTKFQIDKQSPTDYNRWNCITDRETIDEARAVIKELIGKELVSSEVVE